MLGLPILYFKGMKLMIVCSNFLASTVKARGSELHRETVELMWRTLGRSLETPKITTGIYGVFSACKMCCTNTEIKCSAYTPVWRLKESDFAQLEQAVPKNTYDACFVCFTSCTNTSSSTP